MKLLSAAITALLVVAGNVNSAPSQVTSSDPPTVSVVPTISAPQNGTIQGVGVVPASANTTTLNSNATLSFCEVSYSAARTTDTSYSANFTIVSPVNITQWSIRFKSDVDTTLENLTPAGWGVVFQSQEFDVMNKPTMVKDIMIMGNTTLVPLQRTKFGISGNVASSQGDGIIYGLEIYCVPEASTLTVSSVPPATNITNISNVVNASIINL